MQIDRTITAQCALRFIQEHGGGRITQATIDYYAGAVPDEILCIAHSVDRVVVSMSGCALIGGGITHSYTVTHREHRRKGYGTITQGLKIETLESRGYQYSTVIAADNTASLRMAEKNGLVIKETIKRQRRSGAFQAHILFKNTQIGNDIEETAKEIDHVSL